MKSSSPPVSLHFSRDFRAEAGSEFATEDCLNDRIFLAGLLGGIAMFFWTYAANTVLPLGNIGIRRLPNESAVLDVLQRNIAEHSGISPGSDRRRIRRTRNSGRGFPLRGAGRPTCSEETDIRGHRAPMVLAEATLEGYVVNDRLCVHAASSWEKQSNLDVIYLLPATGRLAQR